MDMYICMMHDLVSLVIFIHTYIQYFSQFHFLMHTYQCAKNALQDDYTTCTIETMHKTVHYKLSNYVIRLFLVYYEPQVSNESSKYNVFDAIYQLLLSKFHHLYS